MANEKRRLIDANDLKNEMLEENPYIHLVPFGYCACSPKTDGELVFKREEVLLAIDSAPTVDAVEVVRCKDCKHSGVLEHTGNVYCKNPLGHNGCVPTKYDDFCSYGERKYNAID